MLVLLACLAVLTDAADWQKLESAHLKNIRPITTDFVRAGEGYFSPDGRQIIFQAEEKGTGNPFYQIFVMDLGTGRYRRVSPGVGRTTCSYFAPDGKKIIFASSHLDPDAKKHYAEEYRRREEDQRTGKRRRYQWDFDPYLDIFEANPDGTGLKRLTDTPGYDAEGSYSPDGKQIVFCSKRDGNLELYIMDADGRHVRKLTNAPGCYNGGPFFSPDGKRVIFRSDRQEKDHLQLYVINSDGTGERALTHNLNWVYWVPFWYKDGKHIIFTAADHSNPRGPPELRSVVDECRNRQKGTDHLCTGPGRAAGVQCRRQQVDVDIDPRRQAAAAAVYGRFLATGGGETRRQGDKETRRRGDKVSKSRTKSAVLGTRLFSFSLSPCLLVSPLKEVALRSTIPTLAPTWLRCAAQQQARLTMPTGALGRLLDIGRQLCAIQETLTPAHRAGRRPGDGRRPRYRGGRR